MEKGITIITGADGGMGQVITLEIARAGYPIVMACQNPAKARPICKQIRQESGNMEIEVRDINLASLTSVQSFCQQLLKEGRTISRLINNAGVLTTPVRQTEDGLETIVSVNYVAPYLLTRLLIPLMQRGTRIINTVSCTYTIGCIDNDFFEKGKTGNFSRIQIYGNTKLALLLFTQELAKHLHQHHIQVNAADPGIVNTRMISMHAWFDFLTDIFFRPFIKTAAQGASTAILLALSDSIEMDNGCCFANSKLKQVPERIRKHIAQQSLWVETEKWLQARGFLPLNPK